MKKLIALILALVLVLSLAACGGNKASSDTIRIALTAPLTGNLSQYGESFKNSVELAVKQWNEKGGVLGKQIELVVEDTAGDPAQAATVAQKIVSDILWFLRSDDVSRPPWQWSRP